MRKLSVYESSVTRAIQPRVNLGSVIQALRCNSSSTLPVVRHGSKCFFLIQSHDDDDDNEGGQPDVMNQLVGFAVSVKQGKDCFEFEPVWDVGNQVSISLLEAMQTNKTVRSLELAVNYLEESHLAAIEAALQENDTLQSFRVWANNAFRPAFEVFLALERAREAFMRMLARNMCLRKLAFGTYDSWTGELRAEAIGDLRIYPLKLRTTIEEAIQRNCQAFPVAEALGRVSRSSFLGYPHFGDIGFRRQLLLFFLTEGCRPPRMMLYVSKGLSKY